MRQKIQELSVGSKFILGTTDDENTFIRVEGEVLQHLPEHNKTVVKVGGVSLLGLKYLQFGTEVELT